MEHIIYQVDAFTREVFGGNPAAVIPLDEWLADEVLQAIALENNLSETAYFVGNDGNYQLRWFTPTVEVPLCGHATLASAFVLYDVLGFDGNSIRFESLSGPLYVKRSRGALAMDFPATVMRQVEDDENLYNALGSPASVLYQGNTMYMAIYDSAEVIYSIKPDFSQLKATGKNVIVTSIGEDCDFVSRFFAPVSGIDEDPVTGSAHTALAPYWANRLDKRSLHAKQVSERGGELFCEMSGDRVIIKGYARLYMTGRIEI